MGCALWAEGGPVASFVMVAGQRHAEILLPAVDDLVRRVGWSVADLGGVVVDIGPGLFTGLRVGLATARTIAGARGIPAAGVSSLEVLVHAHRRRRGVLAPVVDARRGEVYWALYSSDGTSVEELLAPAVAPPERVAEALKTQAEAVFAVGDGAWRYRECLEMAGAEVGGEAEMWPSPLALAELGSLRLAGGSAPMRLPEPLYLRPADVRIGWEQVSGRVVGPSGDGPGAPTGAGAGPVTASAAPPPKLAL